MTRVLFVCIGNSCRSQMAEGFARAYGGDVITPASAGHAPATRVSATTLSVMEEKNIDLSDHFPKALSHLRRAQFDLVIDMSGVSAPIGIQAPVRVWKVADPVAMTYKNHCAIRDEIERLVMGLVLELRRGPLALPAPGESSGSQSQAF